MARKKAVQTSALPTFEIVFENSFRLKGELYPGLAPNTVGHFIELANSGFYDGSVIQMTVPSGLILIDHPDKTLPHCIPGECELNGCNYNTGTVCEGSVCFYHSTHYDSGKSAFFILLNGISRTVRMVEGAFALFGQVLEGLPLAELMSQTGVDGDCNPDVLHRIASIRVETYGKTYPFETCPEPESPVGKLIMNTDDTDDLDIQE